MAETGQVLHQNRMRLAAVSFGGVVIAIALGTGDARAAETRPIDDAIVLGSQRCLQHGALSRRLGTWLGTDVVDAQISIAIDEEPGAVRFVLRKGDTPVGERTIAVGDDTCEDVTAAVALAVASAIEVAAQGDGEPTAAAPADPSGTDDPRSPGADPEDPGSGTPETAPPATPAPTATATAAAPAPAAPPRDVARDETTTGPDDGAPRTRKGTLAFTVEGAALLGVFPRLAFAIVPAASFGVGDRVELRVSATGALPVTAELEPTGTAEVRLYAGRLDVCGGDHLLGGHAWIRRCGGLAMGGVTAEGVEVEHPRSSLGAWVALAGRAEVQWMPGGAPVGIALSLDGFVPVVRPRLAVQDDDGATTATRDLPLLGASAAVGPCVLF